MYINKCTYAGIAQIQLFLSHNVCVYEYMPALFHLFMLQSFLVLHILQLRTLYKSMFIPEMTFYKKPDKVWLLNQKQPSSSSVFMFPECELHSGQTQH